MALTPVRILCLAIPSLYLLVLGLFLLRKGDLDWDQQLTFHRIALWSCRMFGPMRGWNPLMAGGMSLAGDPQMGRFSISMLLSHVLWPVVAIKLALVFYLVLGWLGAFGLARRLRLDRDTAWLAASLFIANGYILARYSNGHTDFFGSLLLPLWLWAAMASLRRPAESDGAAGRRLLVLMLTFGVLLAVSSDGSPICFLLTLLWVGLDTTVLALQKRSARPVLFLAGAVAAALLLDAAYFLPVIANQFIFTREQAGWCVDPLVFFCFLLLPVRGKFLPVPAGGHELSVYIGPVLAYLIVRYRRFILPVIPAGERRRWTLVSILVFVLGLGPWRALASWLPPGPYDLLHHLPGFRTVSIAPRFWGFLALPFSLAGALAIRAFERRALPEPHRRVVWAGLFLFTLGFEAGTLPQPFLTQEGKLHVPEALLPQHIDTILNVHDKTVSQSLTILPARGLIWSYNNHEYLRGEIHTGPKLILWARTARGDSFPAAARWDGWNDIVVSLPSHNTATTVLLNQNFHPLWRTSIGALSRFGLGNIALDVPPLAAPTQIRLQFRDPAAALGLRISIVSMLALLSFVVALLCESAWRAAARRLQPDAASSNGSPSSPDPF